MCVSASLYGGRAPFPASLSLLASVWTAANSERPLPSRALAQCHPSYLATKLIFGATIKLIVKVEKLCIFGPESNDNLRLSPKETFFKMTTLHKSPHLQHTDKYFEKIRQII